VLSCLDFVSCLRVLDIFLSASNASDVSAPLSLISGIGPSVGSPVRVVSTSQSADLTSMEFPSPLSSVCVLLYNEAQRELALLAELDDLSEADRALIKRWTPPPGSDSESYLRECVAELRGLRRRKK
jgi:hypothetical protein